MILDIIMLIRLNLLQAIIYGNVHRKIFVKVLKIFSFSIIIFLFFRQQNNT